MARPPSRWSHFALWTASRWVAGWDSRYRRYASCWEREVANEESSCAPGGIRGEVQPEAHPVAEVAGQVDPDIGPNTRGGLWQVVETRREEVRPIREWIVLGDLELELVLGVRDLPRVVKRGPGLGRETEVERDVDRRGSREEIIHGRPAHGHRVVRVRPVRVVPRPEGGARRRNTRWTTVRRHDVPTAFHEERPRSGVDPDGGEGRGLDRLVAEDAV